MHGSYCVSKALCTMAVRGRGLNVYSSNIYYLPTVTARGLTVHNSHIYYTPTVIVRDRGLSIVQTSTIYQLLQKEAED